MEKLLTQKGLQEGIMQMIDPIVESTTGLTVGEFNPVVGGVAAGVYGMDYLEDKMGDYMAKEINKNITGSTKISGETMANLAGMMNPFSIKKPIEWIWESWFGGKQEQADDDDDYREISKITPVLPGVLDVKNLGPGISIKNEGFGPQIKKPEFIEESKGKLSDIPEERKSIDDLIKPPDQIIDDLNDDIGGGEPDSVVSLYGSDDYSNEEDNGEDEEIPEDLVVEAQNLPPNPPPPGNAQVNNPQNPPNPGQPNDPFPWQDLLPPIQTIIGSLIIPLFDDRDKKPTPFDPQPESPKKPPQPTPTPMSPTEKKQDYGVDRHEVMKRTIKYR